MGDLQCKFIIFNMRNINKPKLNFWKIWISPEELFYRYIKQRWSIYTIAKYYKCGTDTIFARLKTFDIPRRSTTEVLKHRKLPESHIEKIRKASTGRIKSKETKEKLKISALNYSPEIRKKMHERLVETIAGSKHWNWKGGKPHRPKGGYYYNIWRKTIFARDKFICQLCGIKGYIEAHHIFPYCDYPLLAFIISNGITLCRACHNKTKTKEYEYIPAFIKVLEAKL